MNANLGRSAVLVGFLAALFGIAMLAAGLRGRPRLLRSGRAYAWVILAAAATAVLAMQRALVTHDFSLSYVAENNSLATPVLYSITGMWSALAGSILLWSLLLAGFIAVMVRHFRARATDPLVGWATLVCYVVAAFFFGLMLGPANPFKLLNQTVADGLGPNPLLQNNRLVAFHPPMLYLGFVGFTIPFAFAVASLITGRVGEGWLVETRRWTMVAWGFLTVGVVLGAWWSYEVLGWGGYWAWDPVENASLLPWLTGTAYLHSVVVQERRGMLRVWNLSLLSATFCLTILGTFLTRSGVLQSVHSFSKSAIGPLLLGFLVAVVVTVVGLIAWRADRLRSPGSIDSPISREGAFLLNNLLFAAFAFVVLLGTVFPLLIEALKNEQISVGAPYFDTMVTPIALTLLFLMAVAPALPWRVASADMLRRRLLVPAITAVVAMAAMVASGLEGLAAVVAVGLGTFAAASALRQLALAVRRQGWRGLVGRANGGMIVHLGVVLIAVAISASHAYGHRQNVTVSPGQTVKVRGHAIELLAVTTQAHPNRTSVVAELRVDGDHVFRPAISTYPGFSQAIGTPAVRTDPLEDLYLTFVSAPDGSGGPAVIGVIIQPLVLWLWVGGIVMGLGTVLAVWPGRRRRPSSPVSAPVEIPARRPRQPASISVK